MFKNYACSQSVNIVPSQNFRTKISRTYITDLAKNRFFAKFVSFCIIHSKQKRGRSARVALFV